MSLNVLMVTLEVCEKHFSGYWCTMVARWLFELQTWGLPRWLRLHTFTARGTSLISYWETKILHVAQSKKKKVYGLQAQLTVYFMGYH